MSFHLLTYQQTLSAASLTAVNAINDQAMPTVNSRYSLPNNYQGLFAYALGPTINRAVIDSPSLNVNFSSQIRPVIVGSLIPTDPNTCIMLESPLTLPALEGIAVKVLNGGSENTYCAIGATTGIVPAARGPIKILRGTATTTLVANTYTQLSITWDATIQPGLYDVVSAEVQSANGMFFRLIGVGTTQQERPGGACIAAVGNRANLYFTARFAMGSWLTFRPEVGMPAVEVIAPVADTAQVVYLYLVQRGS